MQSETISCKAAGRTQCKQLAQGSSRDELLAMQHLGLHRQQGCRTSKTTQATNWSQASRHFAKNTSTILLQSTVPNLLHTHLSLCSTELHKVNTVLVEDPESLTPIKLSSEEKLSILSPVLSTCISVNPLEV